MRQNYFVNLFFTVFFLWLPSLAQANFVGNDTSNFNPIASDLDFVTVHGSDTLSPGYFNITFFANQATNSLPDTRDNNGNLIGADDRMIFGDIGFAFGFSERFEAAASLSYLLEQVVDRTQPGAQFAGTGLNASKLIAKYAFLRKERWGSALIVSMNINATENNPFVGAESGPTTNIEATLDYRTQVTTTAFNVGYRFRRKGTDLPNSVYDPIGDQILASVATNFEIESWHTKLIAEIYASKLTESMNYVPAEDISAEAIAGVRYQAHRHAALHGGLGTRISEGLFTPDWRVYLGLAMSFDLLGKEPSNEYLNAPEADIVSPPAPAPTPPPRDVVDVIRLENLDFDFGSSQILPRHYAMLNSVIDYLATKPDIKKISIEGHTDSVGSPERNRKRSQERADNVKKYLQKSDKLKNIEMESVGYGADRPISDNKTSEGRSHNRRVEVRIMRHLD